MIVHFQLGFLYARYAPQYDWWEIGVMIRKLLIVISFRFITMYGYLYQAGAALTTLSLSCLLTAACRPYYSKYLQRLEIASLLVNSITLGLGIAITSESVNELYATVVVRGILIIDDI